MFQASSIIVLAETSELPCEEHKKGLFEPLTCLTAASPFDFVHLSDTASAKMRSTAWLASVFRNLRPSR